jgi:hypothetical protein
MQAIRILYKVAPISIARQEKGKACFIFQAAGESGVIIVPYPKWFKRYKWVRFVECGEKISSTSSGGKGQPVAYTRYRREERNFWNYIDAVILDFVSKHLSEKNYSPFRLEIAAKSA